MRLVLAAVLLLASAVSSQVVVELDQLGDLTGFDLVDFTRSRLIRPTPPTTTTPITYRITATGNGTNNLTVQRQHLINGRFVTRATHTVRAGTTRTFTFRVVNVGSTVRFRLSRAIFTRAIDWRVRVTRPIL